MLTRRTFLMGAVGLALARAVEAQPPGKVWRIGYLAPGPSECPPTMPHKAFRQVLLDAGYVEGRDVILDRRCFSTSNMAEKLLDEVLKTMPDVLLASGPAAFRAREKVPFIPVVFVDVPDPVSAGFVKSLARPGTNMTGLANITLDLHSKRVQILKEVLPGVRVISTLSSPGADQARTEVEQAAGRLGWHVRHSTVKAASELPGAFEAMKNDGTEAFIILYASPIFWTERVQVANLAVQHRLPGMYTVGGQVEAGGLIGYGAEQVDLYRRAAGYVVKILRGANPGDLPVEEPTKFDLIINLKTAKALRLTIPPSLLLRADRVIE